MELKKCFEIKDVVITAHRGFSGKYPENTLLAFQKAVDIGVDIVEFDIRQTSDGEIVILHDESVDRTTNGSGLVTEHTLEQLKTLNATYWEGPHDTGRRREEPLLEGITIPVLEETLELLAGKVAINIQVYLSSDNVRCKAIELFDRFNLYGHAFFMVATFDEAEFFRSQNANVELCVGEDRSNLNRHHDWGLKIIQPLREFITSEFCDEIRKLGLWANMFYSNTNCDNQRYLEMGIHGIMTDNPDILIKSIGK